VIALFNDPLRLGSSFSDMAYFSMAGPKHIADILYNLIYVMGFGLP